MYSAAAASLTVKISKITKKNMYYSFVYLPMQELAKIVVEHKRDPGQGRSGTIYVVPPSPHFLATPLLSYAFPTCIPHPIIFSPHHHDPGPKYEETVRICTVMKVFGKNATYLFGFARLMKRIV